MSTPKLLPGLTLSTLLLGACGGAGDSDQPRNLAEDQKQAMEKAAAVEAQLQEAAEQRAEQIDEQVP